MRFSQRIGKTPIKNQIQIESMNDDLRTCLWNGFYLYFDKSGGSYYLRGSSFQKLFYLLWHHFFKNPIDTLDDTVGRNVEWVRKWFFEAEWYQVYDFIEFVSEHAPKDNEAFRNFCNDIFQQELSGYRFVNEQLAPITNENELQEIESALETSDNNKLSGVHTHLKAALSKLSDRKKPDYRNSIKESISAVESLCQVISGDSNAELGKALNKLEAKIPIHLALKKGYLSIYGYTSDADGIRHAMSEESQSDFEDAKYMLVSCSAFINYLIGKSAKAGIRF